MITAEPYLYDRQLYHMLPQEDRWCVNKLALAERLGYVCGPSGTNTPPGDYIIRPIMNLAGMGTGGVFRHHTPMNGTNDHIPAAGYPGHFWCEEFKGNHKFVEYINDVAVRGSTGVERGLLWEFTEDTVLLPLPEVVRGISRYSLAEYKGGKLIEYSTRHIANCASQGTIDDYKTIDPSYAPTGVVLGLTDLRKVPFPPNGWTWEDVEEGRRPWRNG